MMRDLLLLNVLGSVMGGRRKRSRRALRHLTPGLGTILSHPAAALTAAGVAWGIFETLQGNQANQSTQWAGGGEPPNQTWGPPSSGAEASTKAAGGPTATPPLPNTDGTLPSGDVLRLIRLAISAAHADGAMNDHERAAVMQQAKAAGVSELIEQELQARRPLAEIVGGVTDPAHRATLYVLAFTILRADEEVSGAERIYLAQLANLLSLDPATTEKLETETSERIDRLGDQDQPGG
jgi:uncharacterized membrane protein YebE (DUF533 family)